jgi:5,10-methylenetetrahydromethanopterin reductase
MVSRIKLAEELGYRNAWIGDSQTLWREAYSVLGAAAVSTERIIMGTGVTQVTTRHVSVLASAWVTLTELTGGRVAIGLGAGDSSVRRLGFKPVSRAVLRKKVEELRALVGAREIEEVESGVRYDLDYAEATHVPLYIAGGSPKTLRLAGEIADGAILATGGQPEVLRAAIEHIEAGATAAGRSLSDIDVVLWVPASVADDGDAARDSVRAYVAAALNLHSSGLLKVSDETKKRIREIQHKYDYDEHMTLAAKHRDLVPDSLVDVHAVAGTADECREWVRNIWDTGVNQIAIVPFGFAVDDRPRVMQVFAEEVFAPLAEEISQVGERTA